MRQIIIDIETTGLTPTQGDRIVEIAGVEILNGKLTGRTFHTYLRSGPKKLDSVLSDHLA